jgi:hypothetical protein
MRLLHLKQVKWGPILLGGWLIILLSVVMVFVYLYRAWRRVGAVPNKSAYIAWLSIESVFALAAVAGIVWFFVTPS